MFAKNMGTKILGLELLFLAMLVGASWACLEEWSNQCDGSNLCCPGLYCDTKNGAWAQGLCKKGDPAYGLVPDSTPGPSSCGADPGPVPSGGDGGGSLDSITQDMFNKGVTSNGFPAPSEAQYQGFRNGVPRGDINTKREAAMALAQFLHESDGLRAKREYMCQNNGCPGHYEQSWCDAPGKRYYGRGYIQLSWCGNYQAAGQDLGVGDELKNNPDRVAEDENMAWATAFSYWKRSVHTQPGVQEGQFGAATKAINGQIHECQGNGRNSEQSKRRFRYYVNVFSAFGVEGTPDEQGCPY